MNKNKRLVSIALLSAAVVAFQLALIQILSIVQWYHFAYMVISMALLGFGAAGSVLAIFRKRLIHVTDAVLSLLMMLTAAAMAVVIEVSQLSFIRFDSYLLFADYSHIGRLLISYLIFFVPFFLAAIAIGLVFIRDVGHIGKIYFGNLAGSAAGGLLALLLISYFFPNQLPPIIAFLSLLAAALVVPRKKIVLHVVTLILIAVLICWKLLFPAPLILSEYKDLSKTLLLPEAKIKSEKTSPYGVMQMVSSPVLRYAPGLSLTAQQTAQIKMAAFVNGDWYGAITDWKRTDSAMVLDYTTLALPYIISNRKNALLLQAGTGADVAHALTRKVNKIIAVEGNPAIFSLLKQQFANEKDADNNYIVDFHNLDARTFISTDTKKYDLISLPIVGSFSGSSGLYALQEQFILTKQSFRRMWDMLHESGVISVTSWIDYPIRNPLKIVATMVEVLRDAGIKNMRDHIIAVRSWGTITFVMTRSTPTPNELKNIRAFCDEMMFDPVILPGSNEEESSRHNQFEDDRLLEYVDHIFSSDAETFYTDYDFNIKPSTDDRPYFSQFIKWGNLNRLGHFFGNRSLPFFEIGYLIMMLTLVQISIVAVILIIAPLFTLGWKGKMKLDSMVYFTGIGIGYMFVEIVFIQRFILYFGTPVYAASAVIASLLIFSGLGSYFSAYFMQKRKRITIIMTLIVLLLLTYSFVLTPVLQKTIDEEIFLKIIVVLLFTAPLGFFMGVPFPIGISYLSKTDAAIIPWAWGINGCISVISTVLATVIAVELGFMWVMIFASLAYCLPLMIQMKWRR